MNITKYSCLIKYKALELQQLKQSYICVVKAWKTEDTKQRLMGHFIQYAH